ncbi:sensor histidine kinase [Tepidibacter aestuarii]|uniref:sensor histidine kinase n=1 Tax=Tepidibacter aestuarii TaxID=2925782 RepID=UPI0020BF12E0|nr:ATP-binding protein [Tepidibacter aestuarii]CAH2212250.1 Histidine kinase [Tepidibacter aestuarii]
MSIKSRLILSFFGMIVIPVILITIFNFMFDKYFWEDDKSIVNAANPYHFTRKVFTKYSEISRKVNLNIINNSDKIKDTSFLESLDNELDGIYSGIILRRDDQILYSSEILKNDLFLNELPKFNSDYNIDNYIFLKNGYVIFSQNDFYFNDGSKGSVFYAFNINLLQKDIKKARTLLSAIIIISILVTSNVLTFTIYRDIIKKLDKLKYASKEIKSGNLNYKIEEHSKDEFGDLSINFEKMRIKLKESLDIQFKYEENRRNLISNISHDLKTPIMSIKGYIEGIKDGVADSPEKMDKYINTIYKKATDMEVLIDELFLFSKLDLKKVSFNFQTINIVDYLKYCVEDLSFDLEKKNAKISFNNEKENIFVTADLQKLKRVIVNIVENSMKYMDKQNPIIDINLIDNKECVIIEIKDNGMGIPEESIPFIFDRFYRADKSRNTSISGSGLGLSICKQIIESHGGCIWAESETNVGTSILFTLKKYKRNDEYEKNSNN